MEAVALRRVLRGWALRLFLTVASLLLQVAEFVDERPEEVKQMEAFRSSAKWKLLGGECRSKHNYTSHFCFPA